jgi:hypothetical protein
MEASLAGSGCPSMRGCFVFNGATPTILLNGSDPAGALAVTLAHEGGGHLTERGPRTTRDQTNNEMRAWRMSVQVYDRLSRARKAEADAIFVDANGNNQLKFFKEDPSAARQQFHQRNVQECKDLGRKKR